MSNEIKIYRANAYFTKNKRKISFTFECRAHKVEDALERIYNEIGSRHRVKRSEIYIAKKDGLKEISPDEASLLIFEQVDEPDFVIQIK